MLFSKQQADQFFGALRAASARFLADNGLPVDQGRKRYASWKKGHPIGITEHYTAGVTWKGTVRWLNDGGTNNSVSCQMLILDRMLPEYQVAINKYPELKNLRVTTLLMSDGIIPCWHAGWVNRFNFGIENRNVGTLNYDGDAWHWWAKNWGAKYPVEKLGKHPVCLAGRWWEPYTYGQVCANILVCQMLYCLYPKMDPRWFLPHSATSGTKSDTGPVFPLDNVRDAVFEQRPVGDLGWLHEYKADPQYMDDYDEEEDREFLAELILRQGDRLGVDGEYDLQTLDEIPEVGLQLLVEGGNWRHKLPAVRRALNLLGYHVPAIKDPVLDSDTALAVWIFQKSQKGLVADKIPGGKTQFALSDRLQQFRLHVWEG